VLRDLPAVADAMNRTVVGLVDISVLQNKRGHVETIVDLVNQEMKADAPSDVVLFLGPMSRLAIGSAEVLENLQGEARSGVLPTHAGIFGRPGAEQERPGSAG